MSETVFLRPVDGWSFRDGKPFDAGEAFEASSIFPPSPWSTSGCIRTTLLRRLCGDPERYAGRPGGIACPKCGEGPCLAEPRLGKAGEAPPFDIGPPLLGRLLPDCSAQVFYPCPRDLVYVETDSERPHFALLLEPLDLPKGVVVSLFGLRPVGAHTPGRIVPHPCPYLDTADLSTYLAGKPPDPYEAAPRVYEEPRIGVGIDAISRSAAEGKLYIRDVIRLEETAREQAGLVVRTGVAAELAGETGRLGGDGRMVSFLQVTKNPEPPTVPDRLEGRFKLYFASPTWFERAPAPAWLSGADHTGQVPQTHTRVRLAAACLADSRPIGGWDIAKQQPREMRRLMGAGSVLYFEILAGSASDAARALHARPLCDDPAMAKAGFGLAFVGRY